MSEKKKYQKTVAKRREVQCYPPPKTFLMVQGFTLVNEMKRSEAAVHMMRCFFDSLSPEERTRYYNAGIMQAKQNQINTNSKNSY